MLPLVFVSGSKKRGFCRLQARVAKPGRQSPAGPVMGDMFDLPAGARNGRRLRPWDAM
jgi:hypothetical protein